MSGHKKISTGIGITDVFTLFDLITKCAHMYQHMTASYSTNAYNCNVSIKIILNNILNWDKDGARLQRHFEVETWGWVNLGKKQKVNRGSGVRERGFPA